MRNLQGILALALLLVLLLSMWLMRRTHPSASPPSPAADMPAMTESAAAPPASARGGSGETVFLVGRILDAQGLPFRALRIVLRGDATGAREMLTDADGAFKFRSIPREPVALDLSAEFDEAVPLGQRTLACRVEPLALDLAAGPDPGRRRIDIGTHVLPRSRPCWIQGQVLLEKNWERWLGDVRIELETPSLDEFGNAVLPVIAPRPGALADWSAPPWRRDLPPCPTLALDGTFRFAVETPHDPFLVVARLERFESQARFLRPVPDRVLTETFALAPP